MSIKIHFLYTQYNNSNNYTKNKDSRNYKVTFTHIKYETFFYRLSLIIV
jgi:hypothetical protein